MPRILPSGERDRDELVFTRGPANLGKQKRAKTKNRTRRFGSSTTYSSQPHACAKLVIEWSIFAPTILSPPPPLHPGCRRGQLELSPRTDSSRTLESSGAAPLLPARAASAAREETRGDTPVGVYSVAVVSLSCYCCRSPGWSLGRSRLEWRRASQYRHIAVQARHQKLCQCYSSIY